MAENSVAKAREFGEMLQTRIDQVGAAKDELGSIFENTDESIGKGYELLRASITQTQTAAKEKNREVNSAALKRYGAEESAMTILHRSTERRTPHTIESARQRPLLQILELRNHLKTIQSRDILSLTNLYAIYANIPSTITVPINDPDKFGKSFVIAGVRVPVRPVSQIKDRIGSSKVPGAGSVPLVLNKPYTIRLHPTENLIFLSELWAHHVSVLRPDWSRVTEIGKEGRLVGELKYPRGIAIHHDGTVLIVDNDNNRVCLYSPTYELLRTIGTSGSDDGQFSEPYNAVFDTDGFFYVTDRDNYRIQKFAKDGTFVQKWDVSPPDSSTKWKPEGIVLSTEQTLLVTSRTRNLVLVYTRTGDLIRGIPVEASGDQYCDICLTANDGFAISDCGKNIVRFYDADGSIQNTIEVDSPVGMAFGFEGEFFVISKESNEVDIY